MLARAKLARNLSSNCWARVVVTVSPAPHELRVVHNDVEYLRLALPHQWAPRPEWVFGLGASAAAQDRTPAPVSAPVRVDNWRLTSALLTPSRLAGLRLSANAQQYVPPLNFSYYRPPVLSEIVPRTGPLAGGTAVRLYGHGLTEGSHRVCRFARDAPLLTPCSWRASTCPQRLDVPASLSDDGNYVRCVTPAYNATAGAAAVEERVYLSLNGQQFHASAPRFAFTPPPRLAALLPASGPSLGGTHIEVRGVAALHGDRYRCRFEWDDAAGDAAGGGGANATVAASLNATDATLLRCISPPAPAARNASVRIGLNAQQFSQPAAGGALAYTFYAPPTIETFFPAGGPSDGGTAIRLGGAGLLELPASTTHCRVGGRLVPARLDPDLHPRRHAAHLGEEIAIDGAPALVCDAPPGGEAGTLAL